MRSGAGCTAVVLATGDEALRVNSGGNGPVSAEWMIPKVNLEVCPKSVEYRLPIRQHLRSGAGCTAAVLATGDEALRVNSGGNGPVSAEWMIPKVTSL